MALEIATYYPEQVLTNEEIASWKVPIEKPLTAQSIYEKVGVKQRYVTGANETVLSMGLQAVQALPSSPQPDVVFFSTSYPDGVNNASCLIRRLNLTADGCMNVHAACSGFTLALEHISERPERFSRKRILIAASEKYSPFLPDLSSHQEDPSLSQAIFSDGATVMEFTESEDIEILNVLNYSFPQDISTCLRMPINYDLVRHPALVVEVPASEDDYFWMDGRAVYKALRTPLPNLILEAIWGAKLKPEQIKLIIPHQASKPMVGMLRKRLPKINVFEDLEDGNWSSASIPKAMAKALSEGAISRGDRIVFAGFGAGLFASVSVIQLN